MVTFPFPRLAIEEMFARLQHLYPDIIGFSQCFDENHKVVLLTMVFRCDASNRVYYKLVTIPYHEIVESPDPLGYLFHVLELNIRRDVPFTVQHANESPLLCAEPPTTVCSNVLCEKIFNAGEAYISTKTGYALCPECFAQAEQKGRAKLVEQT